MSGQNTNLRIFKQRKGVFKIVDVNFRIGVQKQDEFVFRAEFKMADSGYQYLSFANIFRRGVNLAAITLCNSFSFIG